MAIETGTDRNEIDRFKHCKEGAARAENGPVLTTSTVQNIAINCNWYW